MPIVVVMSVIMPMAVRVALQRHHRRRADHGERCRRVGHLGVLRYLVGRQHRHAHAGQDLVGPHRRLERPGEEIISRNCPRPRRPLQLEAGPQRRQHRRIVRGRVRVRCVATDGPPVPHRRIADAAGCLRQDAAVGLDLGRGRDLLVRRQRPDANVSALDADASQPGNSSDVHHPRRSRQPQFHQRDQAVAAGDDLGVRVSLQDSDGPPPPILPCCIQTAPDTCLNSSAIPAPPPRPLRLTSFQHRVREDHTEGAGKRFLTPSHPGSPATPAPGSAASPAWSRPAAAMRRSPRCRWSPSRRWSLSRRCP